MKRIFLSPPHMGTQEQKYVKEAFDTNWISPVGPQLDAFEQELALYLEVNGSVALSSGTAAIHLALVALGVQHGDEVFCQSFTFAGSCNPVVYVGATPVFIDSELETWNMDPELLEAALKEKAALGKLPKAIIVVDLYGVPAKLDRIRTLANHYEVPLIEDAAEALGSTYQNKAAGTWGDIGIYSFNGNKIITTSGGGALIAKDSVLLPKIKFLSTQARDAAPHYEHSQIGYNYRLSNVCAAIGRGQLEVLEAHVTARRNNFQRYRSLLEGTGIRFPEEPAHTRCNRWLTTVLLEAGQPEKTRLHLEKLNIESRPLWKPMHLQPVFKEAPVYERGVSEMLFRTGLCLPSGSQLTDEQLHWIAAEIKIGMR
jgi:dTDP-4-amino-4,6-dideoxygalactose transaminase